MSCPPNDSPRPTDVRSAPRVKIDAFVKVTEPNREFVFRTRDVSRNGLFLYTKVTQAYPFKIGLTLSVELYDYDSSVVCTVVVARVVEPGSAESDEYPTGFGLRIVDISDDDLAHLDSMLSRATSGHLY